MYMYLWISLREQITDYMKSSIYSKVTDSSYLIPFINYDNITYFYLILYLFNENIIQPGATVFMLTFISKICKINWNQNIRLKSAFLTCEGPSWSWLHGSYFINTYNQCLSSLMLWVRIPLIRRHTQIRHYVIKFSATCDRSVAVFG